MAKKSKRNTPKPNSDRARRLAERKAALDAANAVPARPFADMASECDIVALREFVPSATARLPLTETGRVIYAATVLPGALAALVRDEGDNGDGDGATGYVGMQVQVESPDPVADLGAAVQWARTAQPGDSLTAAAPDADSPRLADLVDVAAPLDITVHQNFDWWIPAGVEPDPQVAATVEQANAAIRPSARLADLPGAWWVDAGEKAHLRWVRGEDEDDLMLALARLHASGGLHLGDGSRFAGSFRTHGLLVPVFDLDPERHANEWVAPATEFAQRLGEALAVDAALTSDERRSRDGLRSRQVTLR